MQKFGFKPEYARARLVGLTVTVKELGQQLELELVLPNTQRPRKLGLADIVDRELPAPLSHITVVNAQTSRTKLITYEDRGGPATGAETKYTVDTHTKQSPLGEALTITRSGPRMSVMVETMPEILEVETPTEGADLIRGPSHTRIPGVSVPKK